MESSVVRHVGEHPWQVARTEIQQLEHAQPQVVHPSRRPVHVVKLGGLAQHPATRLGPWGKAVPQSRSRRQISVPRGYNFYVIEAHIFSKEMLVLQP